MNTCRLTSLRRTQIAILVSSTLVTGLIAPSAFALTKTNAVTGAITRQTTQNRSTAKEIGRTGSGSTLPVTSCEDDGSDGTLRQVIIGASTGDTIDLSQLTCSNSSITLQTGQIQILVDDLTIQGPGEDVLTIDGNYGSSNASSVPSGRVFIHHGAGTLTINDLTVANGLVSYLPGVTDLNGGCILSSGSVTLTNSTVTNCRVIAGEEARGGGIEANYAINLYQSTVSNNLAEVSGIYAYMASGGGFHSPFGPVNIVNSTIINNNSEVYYTGYHQGISQAKAGGGSSYFGLVTISGSIISGNFAGCDTSTNTCYQAFGGGIDAENGLSILSSTVSNNTSAATYSLVDGGGIFSLGLGAISITNSTISYNHSKNGGGLLIAEDHLYTPAEIISSTINNNSAYEGAGVAVLGGSPSFVNTTISGNTAGTLSTGFGGAVFVSSNGTAGPITFENSTASLNTSRSHFGGAGIVDNHSVGGSSVFQSSIIAGNVNAKSGATYGADLASSQSGATITGGNNLIIAVGGVIIPSDTLNVDPMLGPLRDNGGQTWTQALLAGSPAIDAGNNVANLDFDQRGPGFARTVGAATDIGAFEVQPPDEIFADGFDGP